MEPAYFTLALVGGMVALFAVIGWFEERRRRDVLALLREMTARGQEPPPALLDQLKSSATDWSGGGGDGSESMKGWQGVTTYAALAAGFGIASIFVWEERTVGLTFLAVAAVMAVMAVVTGALQLFRRNRAG